MLFANSQVVGTFKGFNERGLEFAAEIVAPYDASMLDRPQLGQFLLIELGSIEEAALGRITRFVPSGLLATPEGEDYVNTMQRRQQVVPEDLKQQRLKYRVQVKLLGAVRSDGNKIIYVPSQRRLPHLGAKVALPSAAVLQELCRLSRGETELGDYVLGEFVYCGAGAQQKDPAMRSMEPRLKVTFDIKNLVSRRSVVFARAGYGKSNLIKFLVAELYRSEPKTDSGLNVGTLIFDPDGEYFWPDIVKGRPGLCDVPQLRDKLVVFTNRPAPSAYYGSWKAGEVKLDIRDLPPRDVIGLAVSRERQEQQNILKLKGVSPGNWRELVDLAYRDGLQVTDEEIGRLLGYSADQIRNSQAEIGAARSNMFNVVRLLHDPGSRVLSGTLDALSKGSIVVLDISLLSSAAGNMLAGLLLRRIFSHNQENFTGGTGGQRQIIPVVTIIEEAQSVLGKNLDDSSPYVEWVKEGRKYDLGAMLVTQQPGSMASELLSQADNWFCFHLLSEGDAGTLGKYNSHFSDDILAHLIAEPIAGNCFMWSAPHQPFVLPVRIRSFEGMYQQHVNADPAAVRVSGTRAQAVTQAVSTATDRLKQGLIAELNAPGTKFISIPNALPDGGEGIGIYSGQLYRLIEKLKTPADVQKAEQLKKPLMSAILGEGNFHVIKHGERDYYCATRESWEAAGIIPRIRG
jgi:DNA helicase HerA-like ATPase